MKYQALLLSLVILISLLINPIKNTAFESSKSYKLSSVELSKPISKSSKPIIGINPLVAVSQTLSSTISGFGENLSAAKIIFANSFDTIFSQSSKADIEIDTQKPEPSISSDVLTSQSNINNSKVSPCMSSVSNFTSQEILVKKLTQYSSADEIIFQLNSEKRWPIASLSKLMTAVIAIEKMDQEKEITLSEKAVSSDGTAGDFKIGEIFKLKDLIKAMLISSSNDAAVAISENFENGEENFINEMQKKASQLKMFSTTYLEPTGLSFVNQSTVSDLAKLVDYIYFNYSEIFEISRQKEAEIIELKSDKSRIILATDKFAGDNDFLGGKTGYIDAAGRNLIAIFDISGKTILIITLGADDAFKETEKLKGLVQNCEAEP